MHFLFVTRFNALSVIKINISNYEEMSIISEYFF